MRQLVTVSISCYYAVRYLFTGEQFMGIEEQFNEFYEASLNVDILELIVPGKPHPIALRLLQMYGRRCKARFRICPVHYNGRGPDGHKLCVENSIFHALDTGMELWSGYIYDWIRKELVWHLWNVDHQGYVFDVTCGIESNLYSYFGVRLDPWDAHQTQLLNPAYLDKGVFLWWSYFHHLEKYFAMKYNFEISEDTFFSIMERELKEIMIAP